MAKKKINPAYLRRQADALQRHHGSRDRTDVAAQIGVSTDQLKRYLLGTTLLRPDLVTPLAGVYGIDPIQLATELGIVPPTTPLLREPWNPRAELERHDIGEKEIQQALSDIHGLREETQRQAVRVVILTHELAAQIAKEREASA